MHTLIKNLFGTKPSKPIRRNGSHLSIETLEERSLMAVTAVSLTAGTLSIVGSSGDDQICVRIFDDLVVVDGGGNFNLSDVQRVNISALGGNDVVRLDGAQSGASAAFTRPATVDLGSGDDLYRGGPSIDNVFGGIGNDTMYGGASDDYLDGGAGSDYLYGDAGNDKLHGDTGDDVMYGGANNDVLCGGAGVDSMRGGDGNDSLDGGTGTDMLFGESGHDLFSDDFPGTSASDFTPYDDTLSMNQHFAWFDMNIVNDSVRQASRFADRDGVLDRADMLAVFASAKDGNVVSADEVADLGKIVNQAPGSMPDSVHNLSFKVVFGDAANAHYQGAELGNLSAGSSGTRLQNLVNKWFLGMDHPEAKNDAGTTTYQYKLAQGQLYQNGIAPLDIDQGAVGDCYFMSTLATAAQRSPSSIQNMITDNGDGTYTVRFFKSTGADYVTVDRYLPVSATDYFVYANNSSMLKYDSANNELWVALVEKAYAQINESGWIGQDGTNSYQGLSGGGWAPLQQVTGQSYTTSSLTSKQDLIDAVNAGKMITIATKADPPTAGMIGNHMYSVQGYDASTGRFKLLNPWNGANTYIELTWADLQASCTTWGATTIPAYFG